jgi:hypothetical protein
MMQHEMKGLFAKLPVQCNYLLTLRLCAVAHLRPCEINAVSGIGLLQPVRPRHPNTGLRELGTDEGP